MDIPFTRKLFLLLGSKALAFIEEAAADGEDRDGKPYAYSTKPFARPVGGLNKTQLGRLMLKRNTKGDDPAVKPFQTAAGNLWLLIKGGYLSFKEIAFRRAGGGPFLQATGDMFRAMNVVAATDQSATIGFTDEEAARRAFFLNVAGAGPSRKTWKFLGLRPAQQAVLADLAAERLAPETATVLAEKLTKRLQKAIDAGRTNA